MKPQKILIAIVTCEKFKARAQSQRDTWVPLVKEARVLFFLGKQDRPPLPDEVFLDVPDDYHSLPRKVQEMVRWAKRNGYTKIFKTDDDSYIFPRRLMDAIPKTEYAGSVNMTDPTWCSGFGYWLGSEAMTHLVKAKIPEGEWAEDRWVGSVMAAKNIVPVTVPGIIIANCIPRRNIVGPDTILACEFAPDEMVLVHRGPRTPVERADMLNEQRRQKTFRLAMRKPPMRGDGRLLV